MRYRDPDDTYEKYRRLNREYLSIVEQLKRTHHDMQRVIERRIVLDGTLWNAEMALTAAYDLEDPLRREFAAEDAQKELDQAADGINRANRLIADAKKEQAQLKKELMNLLQHVRRDRTASTHINTVLLQQLVKEKTILTQNHDYSLDLRNKLSFVQNNLSGLHLSGDDADVRQEYDVTMKSIVSLTDMIEYFQEQEKQLRATTVVEDPDASPPPAEPRMRDKTEEEIEADRAKAGSLIEQEIRPRKIDRAKGWEKISEIINAQAAKVDLDPRDIQDVNTVEAMQIKKETLTVEIGVLKARIELLTKIIRPLERAEMLRNGSFVRAFRGKLQSFAKRKSDDTALEDTPPPEEEEDGEGAIFVDRFKVMQRELHRRYNDLTGTPDNLTEHAYEETEEP